jgi:hypothetical protein
MSDASGKEPRTAAEPGNVAWIQFGQAVVVALISGAAGVVATLIGTGALSRNAPRADSALVALRVHQVEFDLDRLDRRERGYRVIATVNGHSVSFPTHESWAGFGETLTSERLAVPVSERYTVRLEALVLDRQGKESRFASKQDQALAAMHLHDVMVHDLVEEGTHVVGRVAYELYPIASKR